MPTISLCMIVKDEEKVLERQLSHIKDYVDEIIIVDTGSKDKTKEIAKRFTKKVYDFKWSDDFSAARNFSISKATKDWILVLDADEFIDKPEKMKEIVGGGQAEVYRLKRFVTRVDQKKLDDKRYFAKKLKGVAMDFKACLFLRSLGLAYEGRVHEQPKVRPGKRARHKTTGIKIFNLGDNTKAKMHEEYYSLLCKKAVEEGNHDANIMNSLLSHYIHKKDFKSLNSLLASVPFFKIRQGMHPHIIKIVKTLQAMNKEKQAKMLAEVLYKNANGALQKSILKDILKI